METVSKFLLVALGGSFGAMSRYGMNLLFGNVFLPFPFATFLINVIGSFLIGFLLAKFGENETVKLLLVSGFLGAYTTFSAFEYEAFQLTQTKQLMTAFLYVSLSFAIGFIGVAGGVWLARRF
ncbi:MAG TPA: fluoride efflux transporter CrcB [Pyrinomonadaceae bacterium]|nr:fluoride efflux transporter CrcB [Pyrinomonadaceae bacterium]